MKTFNAEEILIKNMSKLSSYSIFLNILVSSNGKTYAAISSGGIKDLFSTIKDTKEEAIKSLLSEIAIFEYLKKDLK